jgi:ankyrin repeat protein
MNIIDGFYKAIKKTDIDLDHVEKTFLKKIHPNITEEVKWKWRALHYSVYKDYNTKSFRYIKNVKREYPRIAFVKMLVEIYEADLSKETEEKYLPIHVTSFNENIDMETVKYLIDMGNRINQVDKNGMTSVMWACRSIKNMDILRLYMDRVDMSKVDKNGNTFLHHLFYGDNIQNLKIVLIDYSIPEKIIYWRNKNGKTILDYVDFDIRDLIKEKIEKGKRKKIKKKKVKLCKEKLDDCKKKQESLKKVSKGVLRGMVNLKKERDKFIKENVDLKKINDILKKGLNEKIVNMKKKDIEITSIKSYLENIQKENIGIKNELAKIVELEKICEEVKKLAIVNEDNCQKEIEKIKEKKKLKIEENEFDELQKVRFLENIVLVKKNETLEKLQKVKLKENVELNKKNEEFDKKNKNLTIINELTNKINEELKRAKKKCETKLGKELEEAKKSMKILKKTRDKMVEIYIKKDEEVKTKKEELEKKEKELKEREGKLVDIEEREKDIKHRKKTLEEWSNDLKQKVEEIEKEKNKWANEILLLKSKLDGVNIEKEGVVEELKLQKDINNNLNLKKQNIEKLNYELNKRFVKQKGNYLKLEKGKSIDEKTIITLTYDKIKLQKECFELKKLRLELKDRNDIIKLNKIQKNEADIKIRKLKLLCEKHKKVQLQYTKINKMKKVNIKLLNENNTLKFNNKKLQTKNNNLKINNKSLTNIKDVFIINNNKLKEENILMIEKYKKILDELEDKISEYYELEKKYNENKKVQKVVKLQKELKSCKRDSKVILDVLNTIHVYVADKKKKKEKIKGNDILDLFKKLYNIEVENNNMYHFFRND